MCEHSVNTIHLISLGMPCSSVCGDKEITLKRASEAFTKAFRVAGIQAVLHCLRNTFAIRTLHALTKRQKNGEDMNPTLTLRILMGHSSVAVTENYLNELNLRPETISEDIAYLYGEVIEDEDVDDAA